MIQCCTSSDIQRALDYIGQDFSECIYLYLNLKKYGIGNPNVTVWLVEQQQSILGICLRYHECLQLFSKEHNVDILDMQALLLEQKPKVFFCSANIEAHLQKEWLGNYKKETMDVFEAVPMPEDESRLIYVAKEKDLEKVARFMMTDPTFSEIYNLNSLVAQLRQRMKDRFGRIFYTCEEGEIAATAMTYAELENMAIFSGLLTAKKYRKMGLCSAVLAKLTNQLIQEGKKVFCLVTVEASRKLMLKMGFAVVGHVSKYHL